MALLVYLLISIIAFSFVFERWTFIDSMYFAVVTFTTIGYGDLSPTTAAGRWFGSLYALSGVAFLAIALGVVGAKLVEAQVETIQAVEQKMSNDVFSLFQSQSKKDRQKMFQQNSKSSFSYLSDYDDPIQCLSEDVEDAIRPCRKLLNFCKQTAHLLGKYTPALIPLIIGASIIGHFEGWTIDRVVYYCVVTTTTIGYGDLTPLRESMRLFAVLFIPLSVGAMGHFLGTLANFIMEQRMRVYDKKLWKHELTLEDLESMGRDCGGDGTVKELDFVIFMLRAMKKVDGELIDEIRKHFRKLDLTKSGTLVREDLEHMARRNLRTARSKLRLAKYKSNLIRKSSFEQLPLYTEDRLPKGVVFHSA